MKHYCRLLLLCTTLVFFACAAPKIEPKLKSQFDSGVLVFAKAETNFRQQSYEKALKIYLQYLNRFPGGPSADLALKRVAQIHGHLHYQDEELNAFRQLAADFPESPHASFANYKIMLALHRKNKSRQVILQASKIIERTSNKDLLFHTYAILGETYLSLDSPIEAVFFYNLAFSNADSFQKENIINKLKDIVKLLNQNDVSLLSMHLGQNSVKSHFLYLLAHLEYERENYEEAKKQFLTFLEEFPRHKNAGKAKLLIQEIDQRTYFRSDLIGCMLPLSGPYKDFGKRALKAIRLAVDRFNSFSGQPTLQLIIKDTRSDPGLITSLVKDLDERGVAMIIGPMVTSKNAAVEAQKRKIPIITLTQRTGIPEIGEYVFRNFLTPEMQVNALLAYATGLFAARSFAVLYPDDSYGNTFMRLFKEKAQYYGAEVVQIVSYTPNKTDFSSSIKQLAKIPATQVNRILAPHRQTFKNVAERHQTSNVKPDFDAIFIPDSPAQIALIAPQLAYWDVDDVLMVGTNLLHSEYVIDIAQNYVQGAILTDVYYAHSTNKVVQNFIQSFEQKYGERPGFIEGLSYDTAMMVFNIIANPDVLSRKELKNRLKEITDFEGVTGLTSFDDNGETKKNLYLLQIIGRNFVQLQ